MYIHPAPIYWFIGLVIMLLKQCSQLWVVCYYVAMCVCVHAYMHVHVCAYTHYDTHTHTHNDFP